MQMNGGEAALTEWAFRDRFQEILVKLADDTRHEDARVIHGPRFGHDEAGSFGALDAIVVTASRIYLVATRWNRCGEVLGKAEAERRRKQLRCHQVLGWYFQEWSAQRPGSWDAFCAGNQAVFETRFPGLTIPAADTALAQSLQHVLDQVGGGGQGVRNVLLYVAVNGVAGPIPDGLPSFIPVRLQLSEADRSSFFAINGIIPPVPVG